MGYLGFLESISGTDLFRRDVVRRRNNPKLIWRKYEEYHETLIYRPHISHNIRMPMMIFETQIRARFWSKTCVWGMHVGVTADWLTDWHRSSTRCFSGAGFYLVPLLPCNYCATGESLGPAPSQTPATGATETFLIGWRAIEAGHVTVLPVSDDTPVSQYTCRYTGWCKRHIPFHKWNASFFL